MNLTTKWETAVEFYIEWLQTGTEKQKELAKDDLRRLATIADTRYEVEWNE